MTEEKRGDDTPLFAYHEGLHIEFKQEWTSTILRTVAAFANTEGGCVLLGVHDDRKIVGIPDDEIDSLQRKCGSAIKDTLGITPRIKVITLHSRKCIKITTPPSLDLVPYKEKNGAHQFFIRIGAQTRVMTPKDLTNFGKNREAIVTNWEDNLRSLEKGIDTPIPPIPAYIEKFIAGFLSSNYRSDILTPPGCYETSGPPNITPGYANSLIPVAAMFEHRFAFYYWALWARETLTSEESNDSFFPPNLFSLDAHSDFGCDCDFDLEEFDHIAYDKTNEMALFSWLRLHPMNDGHIYPAVMLNLVGDVYLLNRQYRDIPKEFRTRYYPDRYGNIHRIKYVDSLRRLDSALDSPNKSTYAYQDRFYLDIDLDFFFYGRDLSKLQKWSPAKIQKYFTKDADVVKWLVRNVGGITFALEPSYTLGISNSLQQYDVLQKLFFTHDPLCDWKACDWKERWKR